MVKGAVKEMVKKSLRPDFLFCPKPETNAPDRFNEIRPAGFPELPAQVADMGFQRAFRAVRGILTDAVQQYGFCDDPAGILHQQFQNGKFRRREPDLFGADGSAVEVYVQGKFSEGQKRNFGKSGCAAQLYGNACQKLFGVKWFCNIVGGTLEEQIGLIVGVGLCAHNDYGDVLDLRQDFFSVKARKHQIQKHQIRPGSGEE